MLIRTLLLGGGLLAVSVVGCSEPGSDIVHGEDTDLIGGSYLADGDLPSTLHLKSSQGNCTATKVGARHILLAAHCVWETSLRPSFAEGQPIQVTTAANATPTTPYQTLTIRHTNVGPEWVERCSSDTSACMAVGYDTDHRASDVAVIETVEEIINVPIAVIDTEPLAPGEAVIVAGYGCQGSVGGYWPSGTTNLKASVVQLLPATATIHSGSQVTPENVGQVAAHDLITPGPAWATPGPGLCPGDSGGPLYRAKGGGATVVGVNGSYTFSGVSGGLPVTNWHTRLDHATARDVGSWLASVGATTCQGATCPTRVPATALAGAPPIPAQTADLVSDGRDMSCQRAATDTSKVQAAIDEVLATNAFCMSLNGQRVARDDGYVYGAIAYCPLIGGTPAPSADAIAGFPAAMAAKGFPNFTYQNGVVTGSVYTPACETFPTGEEACRASLPSMEKLMADVKQSSGQKSACLTTDTVGASGIYYTTFACHLDSPLDAQVQTYLTSSMERLRYHGVQYDAATNTVRGIAVSLPCAVFSSGE